ncbi:RluA family pseudouridine synthase [Pseudorhodoplanes sinuspersici]|uniref:RluA family pseudouridine synthase n=1 Tax=Pseudorhodoplanes sinuspersici TaxID=1235591 RepID=UPI001FD8C362|nr:RluA family pseudouridine synthase [Pseudorhodoplanes sinuspersici]
MRTEERGRQDDRKLSDRKPSGRTFSERSEATFRERKFSDRKFSERRPERRPADDRSSEYQSSERKPSGHKRPARKYGEEKSFEHGSERLSRGRKPDDRKSDGRKPTDRDRKSTDRQRTERKFTDRKQMADRRPEHRKPFERRSPERRQPERNIDQPEIAAETPAVQLSAAVQTVEVTPDENGMRVDRFLEARFAGLSFSHIQRIIRKGQLRVDGKRVEPKDRLEAGQSVRIPPLRLDPEKPRPEGGKDEETRQFLKSITLFEDDDVMVLNKPAGLAVQGGSGTTRHIDGMLGVIRTKDGQRPRLVHRLDKDTAGCLLIAKSRFAAAALAKTFRSRSARKIYWALVPGVPKPKQGRISTYLAKEEREDDSVMRVAQHGEEGASHAITYYAVVETAAARLAWLSLKPVTGRTHQLRVQLAHIGHPIVGDPKYFNIENWELPGGIQNRLHLLARRIAVPHPRGGVIDATAPLPPHMQQTWNLLGLDASRYDPIEDAPEG